MPCRCSLFYTVMLDWIIKETSVHYKTLTTFSFRPVCMNRRYMQAFLPWRDVCCILTTLCTVTLHTLQYNPESGPAESVSRDSFLSFTHSSKNSLWGWFFEMTPHPSSAVSLWFHIGTVLHEVQDVILWLYNVITEVY